MFSKAFLAFILSFCPFLASAVICVDLKSLDLSGSVVQEVMRDGQTYVGPSEEYKVEQSPYSIPGVQVAVNRIQADGGEILSQVFVSLKGALFAAQESNGFQACVLFFVPANEREWVVPLHIKKVGPQFIEVYSEDPNKELLTYRKVD